MKNQNLRKSCLWYAFLFIVFIICSASFAEQYPGWTVYNTFNSGLPDNEINSVVIDANGNKWIGTYVGGLAKFDGTNWTVFSSYSSGLPNNSIYSIAIDSSGNKWIGTYGGLGKYDGANWTAYSPLNSKIPGSIIYSIAIEGTKNKWIGTGGSLAEFHDTVWTEYNNHNSGLPINIGVLAIEIDKNGIKWIGAEGISGSEGGLTKFDGINWTVYNTSNSSLPENVVKSIAIDSSGNKWIGTATHGLAKFDGKNWTIYNTSNSGLPDNSVLSITVDKNENIWIGTSTYNKIGGLAKFDGTNWMVYDTSNSGLPGEGVTAIEIDGSGNKWIGTWKGLAVYNDNFAIKTNPKSPQNPFLPLCRNYPNPFRQKTSIMYNVFKSGPVSLRIYSLEGQLVQTLVNSRQTAGSYTVSWEGSNDKGMLMARGVYIYQLSSNGPVISGRMNFLE